VSFTSDFDPITQATIQLDFESSDFRLLEPGETLFKLAAKARCKELTDSLADAADSDAPAETRILVNPEDVK
jgi:hypothetical protein